MRLASNCEASAVAPAPSRNCLRDEIIAALLLNYGLSRQDTKSAGISQRSSPRFVVFGMISSPRLEIEPQLEFDQSPARIVRTRNGEITESVAGLAERGGIDRVGVGVRPGRADRDTRLIERVEELHAELEVRALGNLRPLHQVDVKARSPRSIQEYARAELTGCGGRADIGFARIERLVVQLERRQRVVKKILRQPVNDALAAAGRVAHALLANLDQVLKLIARDVVQHDA